MNPAHENRDGHDEAARLLPWFVNGTLAPADAEFVETHLKACATCRGDAAQLTQLRAVMRCPGQVEYAPHGGLHKLMQRVDGLADAPVTPPAQRRRAPGMLRWLTGAVVLQSVALAVIGSAAWRGNERDDSAYRTLTAPAALPSGVALRAVFTPSLTLAELQGLLREHGLRVVAGPSEAGLFTLSLQDPQATPSDLGPMLARLRADARVRFAEPLGPQAGTP